MPNRIISFFTASIHDELFLGAKKIFSFNAREAQESLREQTKHIMNHKTTFDQACSICLFSPGKV